MNNQEIFKIIDRQRLEKGYSVATLCRKAGVSYQSWIQIKGEQYNIKTLQKFCKVLDIKEILIKFDA